MTQKTLKSGTKGIGKSNLGGTSVFVNKKVLQKGVKKVSTFNTQ